MPLRRYQTGYLYEIPVLTMVIALVVAIVYPLLPQPWNYALLGLGIAACLCFIVYNSFFAGWQPYSAQRRAEKARQKQQQ